MLITVGVSGVYNNYLRIPGFSAIRKEKTVGKRPLLLFKEIMPTDHVRAPLTTYLLLRGLVAMKSRLRATYFFISYVLY